VNLGVWSNALGFCFLILSLDGHVMTTRSLGNEEATGPGDPGLEGWSAQQATSHCLGLWSLLHSWGNGCNQDSSGLFFQAGDSPRLGAGRVSCGQKAGGELPLTGSLSLWEEAPPPALCSGSFP
jgi:hypothetical protein